MGHVVPATEFPCMLPAFHARDPALPGQAACGCCADDQCGCSDCPACAAWVRVLGFDD